MAPCVVQDIASGSALLVDVFAVFIVDLCWHSPHPPTREGLSVHLIPFPSSFGKKNGRESRSSSFFWWVGGFFYDYLFLPVAGGRGSFI